MKALVSSGLWPLPLLALLAGLGPVARAADDTNEIDQKLQAIRKQIDEFRQQEQALLELQKQQRKEAADKQAQYARVEIHGRLLKEERFWVIVFGGLNWELDLGGKKEILTAAKQQVGEAVVLTGKVEGRQTPRSFGLAEVVVVESLKPAAK